MMETNNYTNLLLKVTSNNDSVSIPKEYENIKRIIQVDILNFLKKDSPINSSDLYFDFKYEYEKMVNFYKFKDINEKQIIALGGGFSTGKSSFINTILKSRILPSNLTPTTAVPTYVISGKDDIQAINMFDSSIELKKDEFKLLTHDNVGENLEFGHLLKQIFVKSSNLKYENIAFLDTPGYSAYDSKEYSDRTDENICRSQLNSADFIFWFVSAENGTINNTDIEFLKTIKNDIPIFIVINKCDKVISNDLKLIYLEVSNKLEKTNLNIKDIFLFSRKKLENINLEKIDSLLKSINYKKDKEDFSENFLEIFKDIEKYYENKEMEMKTHLNRLNIIDTLCTKDEKVEECVNSMIFYYKNTIKECKEKVDNLHKIWENIRINLGINTKEELNFTVKNNNNFLDMINQFIETDNEYSKVVDERRYWRD